MLPNSKRLQAVSHNLPRVHYCISSLICSTLQPFEHSFHCPTLQLPAVFFMTLLPPALADRALGYAAIFLLAWSPALWSLGYSMVTGGEGTAASKGVGPATASSQQQLPPAAPGTAARPALPPPAAQKPHERRRVVSGPDWEVIEGMPPAEGIPFPPTGAQDSSSSSGGGAGAAAAPAPEGGDQPHRHPAVFDQVMQYQLLRSMQQFAKQVGGRRCASSGPQCAGCWSGRSEGRMQALPPPSLPP